MIIPPFFHILLVFIPGSWYSIHIFEEVWNMRDELSLLGAQLTYKKRLEAILAELQTQQTYLEHKVDRLNIIMQEERKDVDRLEGRSLAAFVYFALGKKEEKLDTERREYYAARVKYDAALRELEAVRQDLEVTQEDLMDLKDCETQYAQALERKRQTIEASALPEARKLLEKGRALNRLRIQELELEEALDAGSAALSAVSNVTESLRSAEEWGTLDMLGGGLLTEAKQERLDMAQKNIEELQIQLQRFNKEMADVPIRASMQSSIDAMLQFSDCFLDSLFTDADILEKIKQARSQVEQTRDQILGILRQLQTKLEEVWHTQVKAQAELDEMVLNFEL